ncbi:MAG: hypothetical protein GQ574_14880 [Crocinitomix sp.]|nr:hypothetical protein [Crocinitomix sp.]
MRFLFLTLLIALSVNSFAKADKIPRKTVRSIPLLTDYLTRGKISQKDKATAIHSWVTSNIRFNYNELSSEKYFVGVDPSVVLKAKKSLGDGFVELMKAMLDYAKIENETVSGYVHDVAWNPGDTVVEMNHSWIAMKLDGEWSLADPAWDAGYIGRKPIDRKPYKEKKYIIPLKVYKKEVKREKVEIAREEADEERREEYDEKPKYKDEIDFVQDPTTKFFLINTDTFLLDHLPLNPIWQLRDDYIDIEAFALTKDSLKQLLAEDRPARQDHIQGIDLFQSRDFLHQYILNGEEGFDYNPYNPGVKAINYYNFMVLVNGKKLQKYARGSIYEITIEKHPALLAVNDTIIKYAKLYKVFEKALYKKRRTFDKAKFAGARAADKENAKFIRKIDSENDKLISYIKSNSERIEANLERLEAMTEKMEEKFPSAFDYYKPREGLKDEYINPWRDSMQVEFKKLEAIKKQQNDKRAKSSYISLLTDVRYIDYLLNANASFIRFKTYSNNEIIGEVDSLIDYHAKHSVMLFKDSLREELIQKNVMNVVKKANTFIRLSKADFKLLKTELKIDGVPAYETFMQAQLWEIIKLADQINKNSAHFNEQILPIMKGNSDVGEVAKLIEKQEKLKEEKNEFIVEQQEKSHKRAEDLMRQMQEDTKAWKQKFK